jgi:dolichol kinase
MGSNPSVDANANLEERKQAADDFAGKRSSETGLLRTLYHGFGLVIPIVYLTLLPNRLLVSEILLAIFIGFLLADILRFLWPAWNRLVSRILKGFIKADESNRFNGSTYYFLSATLVIYFLHPYIAASAIFMLSLGDAAACLLGRRFGTIKLFGGKKSLQGFLALFATAFAVGLILLPWKIALVGAFAAAAIEVFPFHLLLGENLARWLDDNLTIPIASGWAMAGAAILAGWQG